MKALNMQPKNLLILAALGIGAYWLMQRNRTTSAAQTGSVIGGKQFIRSPAAAANNSTGTQPNLAAAAFNFLNTMVGGGTASAGTPAGAAPIANTAAPGTDAWGWSYYTDGTAISPEGIYYKNGSVIWQPSTTTDSVSANPANSYSTAGADPSGINGLY